jgi:hypothetical protein
MTGEFPQLGMAETGNNTVAEIVAGGYGNQTSV